MASDGRSKLDRLFCHREVLRSREPELFQRMEPIVLNEPVSSSKPPVPVVEVAVTKQPKTPAALLEECCQRVYSCQPTYAKKDAPIGMHTQVCIFKGYKGRGMARNKTTARHIAALEILRHIVKQNEWRKYGLPGNTAAEADSYIMGLMPELLEPEKQEAAIENWVGKCNELCAAKRLGTQPDYEFANTGSPNAVMFVCTCKLRDMQTKAEGRKKQLAKNLAAREMYALLQQLNINDYDADKAATRMDRAAEAADSTNDVTLISVDANRSPAEKISKVSTKNDGDAPADSTPTDPAFERLKQVLNEIVLANKRQGCVELLNELLKTDSPSVASVYATPELAWIPAMENQERGLKQVYLEIKNRASKERLNIFGGEGVTDTAAKDHAAWQAIQYLFVFGGFADDETDSDADEACTTEQWARARATDSGIAAQHG